MMKGMKKTIETDRHGCMGQQLDTEGKKWKGEYRMGKIIEGETYEWSDREKAAWKDEMIDGYKAATSVKLPQTPQHGGPVGRGEV